VATTTAVGVSNMPREDSALIRGMGEGMVAKVAENKGQ
jgi:hypothetical protein